MTHLSALLDQVSEMVPLTQSVVLWLAAQFDRTLSRYEAGESLVWKDAGTLTATAYFVAEAMGLACCAVGVTGEPHLSALLDAGRSMQGVGGILIGERLI
jgi:nitroreductase